MSASSFNPPPTACSIAPDLAPLVTQIDRESATEFRITYLFANGREESTVVHLGPDGDVDGDAPNEVLCEVERRLAKYGHKYAAVAL